MITSISLKVLNKEEIGHPSLLLYKTKESPRIYCQLLNWWTFWKKEDVEMEFIDIISNNSKIPAAQKFRQSKTGGMTGALLQGTLSALLASSAKGVLWDIEVDIWLADGRIIETILKEEDQVRFFERYLMESKRETARNKRLQLIERATKQVLNTREQVQKKSNAQYKTERKEQVEQNFILFEELAVYGIKKEEAINILDDYGLWGVDPDELPIPQILEDRKLLKEQQELRRKERLEQILGKEK